MFAFLEHTCIGFCGLTMVTFFLRTFGFLVWRLDGSFIPTPLMFRGGVFMKRHGLLQLVRMIHASLAAHTRIRTRTSSLLRRSLYRHPRKRPKRKKNIPSSCTLAISQPEISISDRLDSTSLPARLLSSVPRRAR